MDADTARPARYLRVGVLLRPRSVQVTSIWLVQTPPARSLVVGNPILVRVDVGGEPVAVELLVDPRITRGTMRPEAGHSVISGDEGLCYLSVPFSTASELNGIRIRLTDLTGVAAPTTAAALAHLIEEPSAAMRAVHEITAAQLKASPDWTAVAVAIGIPHDAGRFEVYRDKAARYRWRLRRGDGDIVADSGQGYLTRGECEADLAWVRAHAATVPVHALDARPDIG